MPQSLADLAPGSTARIVSIQGSDITSSRLLEMGLTPGQVVRFLRTALLGDPLEVEVRGYRLSLRRTEASRILVDSDSPAT